MTRAQIASCPGSPSPYEDSMHHVVIFTNHIVWVPAILIRATLEALAPCEDVKLTAICMPELQGFKRALLKHYMREAVLSVGSLFKTAVKHHHTCPLPINLNHCARRHRFRILVPPEGNINHPDFIEYLRVKFHPTIALSFYCTQKFSSDLLGVFSHAVNYHNGILPEYRGLGATEWSIYQQNEETGFTFHRMTENIDAGNILIEETISVDPESTLFDLELEKGIAAARQISRLLRMITNGDQGRPQRGDGRYFSRADCLAVKRISDPSIISSTEITNRLRAFGCLEIKIAEKWHSVTKIKQLLDGRGCTSPLCFRTCDGVILKPVGFIHLPYKMYRFLKWCAGWLRRKRGS